MSYNHIALVRAVERARWLAELADALDQASRLMRRMRAAGLGEGNGEAAALRGRIDALSQEVDSFRRSRRFERAGISPQRMV